MIDEVDTFVNSNVSEKLARFEREIDSYENSLAGFTNTREDIMRAINKLKEDVTTQEIGKRELLDNMSLRKVKETLEALKEQYTELNEKVKSMNYSERTKNWQQVENEKQALTRQVSIVYVHCMRY